MGYPSDLTDAQWEAIRHHFEYSNGYGNRRKHSARTMVNAILYLLKTGCQWRQLPNDLPNWKTVYNYYTRLCKRDVWEAVLVELNAVSRVKKGRRPGPGLAIIDSQSVKTQTGGPDRGFDGGKKSEGPQAPHRR